MLRHVWARQGQLEVRYNGVAEFTFATEIPTLFKSMSIRPSFPLFLFFLFRGCVSCTDTPSKICSLRIKLIPLFLECMYMRGEASLELTGWVHARIKRKDK